MRKLTFSALLVAAVGMFAVAQEAPRASYELPGESLHPEGIAYDKDSDSLFVSGAGTGEILRIDRSSGETSVFVEPSGMQFSVLGLEVAGGQLLVAGAAAGEIRSYSLADGSEVFTASTGEGGLLNDLTVSSTGDVYVTDSYRPVLYRIAAGTQEVEEWLDFTGTAFEYGDDVNANGIVITDDDEHLIIAQLATGQLWLVDIADKNVQEIAVGETFPGADGLVLDGRTLYVIQNGADQVAVVELAEDLLSGEVTGVLTSPDFIMPATAVLVDDQLIVTNTQFGSLETGDAELPFRLTVLPVTH